MKRWTDTHDELVEKLSPDAFDQLVGHFAGRRIRVPRRRRETRREFTERVHANLKRSTYRETAEELGVAVSTVALAGKRSI